MNNKKKCIETVLVIIFLIVCVILKVTYQLKKDILSETQSLKLIEKKYIESLKLYNNGEQFLINNLNLKKDEIVYYEVINYDNILNNMFTKNGKKQFESSNNIVIKDNSKVYLRSNIEDKCKKYLSYFKKKKVNYNFIEYEIENKCNDDMSIKNISISLRYINHKWLVDNFQMLD